MKKMLKKGFTLTELIVVIVIIGILAAVLIPSITGYVDKAKKSNDTVMMTNLNQELKNQEIIEDRNTTMYDVMLDLREAGYTVDQLKTKYKKQDLFWDQEKDQFVLVEKKEVPADSYKLWKFVESYDPEYSDYSQYILKGTETNTVTLDDVKAGIDLGENTNPFVINLNNEVAANAIIIRTNSAEDVININAKNATINHYGYVKDVNITEVADHSYYEYGTAGFVTLAKGKVEVKPEGKIYGLYATSANATVETSKEESIDRMYAKEGVTIENVPTLPERQIESEKKLAIQSAITKQKEDAIVTENPEEKYEIRITYPDGKVEYCSFIEFANRVNGRVNVMGEGGPKYDENGEFAGWDVTQDYCDYDNVEDDLVFNEDNPYISKNETFANCQIDLLKNIDLGGIDFLPIGYSMYRPFCGKFNGGTHTISNFVIRRNFFIEYSCKHQMEQYLGLFGVVVDEKELDNDEVNNLHVEVSNKDLWKDVKTNYPEFENGVVNNKDYVNVDSYPVGVYNLTIKDATIDPMTTTENSGFAIGYAHNAYIGGIKIENCTYGSTNNKYVGQAGGIVGCIHNSCAIIDCQVDSDTKIVKIIIQIALLVVL